MSDAAGNFPRDTFPYDPDLEPVAPNSNPAADGGGAPPAVSNVAISAEAAPAPRIERADPSQWTADVPLTRPLIVDGARLDRVTVRALTGQELVDAVIRAGDNQERLMGIIRPLSAGVHPAVLEALAADDYGAVIAAQRPFLPRLLQDGADAADYVAVPLTAALSV